MTHLLLAMAMAAAMPTADPAVICQPARSGALPGDEASAYQSCVHDEQAARDQLRRKWGQYSAAAHGDCAQPTGVAPSYVEMLTCLEMQSGGNFGSAGVRAPLAAPAPLDEPRGSKAVKEKP